jgi:hypothetical protein
MAAPSGVQFNDFPSFTGFRDDFPHTIREIFSKPENSADFGPSSLVTIREKLLWHPIQRPEIVPSRLTFPGDLVPQDADAFQFDLDDVAPPSKPSLR